MFSLIIKNPGGDDEDDDDEEECKITKEDELLHPPEEGEFGGPFIALITRGIQLFFLISP